MIDKTTSFFGRLAERRRRARTPVLGERELDVLRVLWESEGLSAQQVLSCMPDLGLSLSTVQSTLERLHRKKLLERDKQARAYLYRPLVSRQELISSLLRDITEEIAGGNVAPVVSGFIDYLEEDGAAEKELAQRLQQARTSDGNQSDD